MTRRRGGRYDLRGGLGDDVALFGNIVKVGLS